MIMERIAEFLAGLLDRHNDLHKGQIDMSTSLATIVTVLQAQGQQLAAQGEQIKKLVADRDAKEQADLDTINGLIASNGAASAANAAALLAALGGASGTSAPAGASTSTLVVAVAALAGVSTLSFTGTAPVVGSTLSGDGIAAGTTVSAVNADAGIVTLSASTLADIPADTSLTIAAPTTSAAGTATTG